jgi:hypothetical protein
MGVGHGDKNPTPKKKENCREASKKFSQILRRRPRPTLGCVAKERRRRIFFNSDVTVNGIFHVWLLLKYELKLQ